MSTSEVEDPRALRQDPFEILLALDRRFRAARLDAAASGAEIWQGLAFRLGQRWMVAPREDVREVIPPPRTTRVPHAQPWLLGVANVRGSLYSLVDLGRLFGAPVNPGRAARVLVLNSDRIPAGFLVDEIGGQRQFGTGDQVAPDLDESDPLGPFVLGGFAREDRRWTVLSLRRLAQSELLRRAGA